MAFGLALLLAGRAPQATATPLSDWNLIVRNNMVSSSEIDGSALIGGNLSGTSNYAIQGVTAPSGDGLAVGGNLGPGNIQVNNGGNLRLAGTNSASVNLNGGGVLINDAGVASLVAAALAYAESLSSSLTSYVPNGTVDGAGNMNAVPSLSGSDLVAVYSFTNASIQSLGQLNLNFGTADYVVINLTSTAGTVDLIAPPNLIGGFNQANSSKIVWNMYDATQVLINNTFNGALLAPYADLKLTGGGINGSVVVDSISQQDAEIRRFNYNGIVPEPPSAALLCAGAVGIGAGRRMRRRIAAAPRP